MSEAEERFWQKWDDAVQEYVDAMNAARETNRKLKAVQALTYSAYKRSGMEVEDSKQAVFSNPDYQEAWAAADAADIVEKHARLVLDKLDLRFQEWRTRQASRRAEMTLR